MKAATFLEVMSIFRHDVLNNLQVISGLAQLNKTERIREYINGLSRQMEVQHILSRLSVPEAAASFLAGHILAGKYQVETNYSFNTDLENCVVPGRIAGDLIEEAFKEAFKCIAAAGASRNYINISLNESEKKLLLDISFPCPPGPEAEECRICVSRAGKQLLFSGGSIDVAVSDGEKEIRMVFPCGD